MSAKVISVIETDLELAGDGTDRNPYRRVRQYWTTDGSLLAEVDSYLNVAALRNVVDRARDYADIHRLALQGRAGGNTDAMFEALEKALQRQSEEPKDGV